MILQRTILDVELQPELEMFECFTKVIMEQENAELEVEGASIITINGKMSSPGAKPEGGCGIWPPPRSGGGFESSS